MKQQSTHEFPKSNKKQGSLEEILIFVYKKTYSAKCTYEFFFTSMCLIKNRNNAFLIKISIM